MRRRMLQLPGALLSSYERPFGGFAMRALMASKWLAQHCAMVSCMVAGAVRGAARGAWSVRVSAVARRAAAAYADAS